MPPVKEIYLMRHAEALSQADWHRDDSLRPLADSGVAKLQAALPFIKKSGLAPDIIFNSPYIRAKQTADIVSAIFTAKPQMNPLLAAGASVTTLKTVVNSCIEKASLLIIGHMPDLAHFASAITSDPWLLDDARMDPAAIWALNPGSLENRWGEGKFIWQRNLADWKKI